ncbi:hypothetical protein BT67DRAFT_433030 [Trichocladium antarcticum]|uniref:Uncharacterized protein n=1 Tax=Trichocladium antarcticum TaxID=1450529 RepID=A0AAN6UQZ4_9PEZI|nr:hypothetical protein BT67DRAFT_433030 [Trichocladium antarcticum]
MSPPVQRKANNLHYNTYAQRPGASQKAEYQIPQFKRLASILTKGENTLPAGPATNEQQENSAAAAAAAAAAATAAAALAALPDLEPDPIHKTNIGMPPPPPRVTRGDNTSPAGLATTKQQEGSPAATAAARKTTAKRRAPSATSKRKKKKKEDADELSLQYAKQGHTTKCKIVAAREPPQQGPGLVQAVLSQAFKNTKERSSNALERTTVANKQLVSIGTSLLNVLREGVAALDENNKLLRQISGELRAEPARAEPARAEPARAEPTRAEPARAEPARAEPARAEPERAEPERAEPEPTKG